MYLILINTTHARHCSQADVPSASDEHECRGDGSFCHTQEEPHGNEASVIGACSGDCYDSTPNESVNSHILCYREPGDQVCGGVFPEEVSKVEHAGDP